MRTSCSWPDWKKVCSFPTWKSSEQRGNPSEGAASPFHFSSFISLFFPSFSWELSFKSGIMGGIVPFRMWKNERVKWKKYFRLKALSQHCHHDMLRFWITIAFLSMQVPSNIKTNNLYSEYSLWFLSACCSSLCSSLGIKSHWVRTFKIPIQTAQLRRSSSAWSVTLYSCPIMGWQTSFAHGIPTVSKF